MTMGLSDRTVLLSISNYPSTPPITPSQLKHFAANKLSQANLADGNLTTLQVCTPGITYHELPIPS